MLVITNFADFSHIFPRLVTAAVAGVNGGAVHPGMLQGGRQRPGAQALQLPRRPVRPTAFMCLLSQFPFLTIFVLFQCSSARLLPPTVQGGCDRQSFAGVPLGGHAELALRRLLCGGV